MTKAAAPASALITFRMKPALSPGHRCAPDDNSRDAVFA
jgi:hypothetical protein